MEINLSGKIVLVTGASGELGGTIVRTCASCGADVAVHYHRNETSAKNLMRDVCDMGRKSGVYQANITSAADVSAMKDKICEEIGAPNIIINNAVIQYTWKSILEQDLSDYESQFQSCVTHNVLMIKAFVPDMIKNRYGRVIATNTECSMQMLPTQSAYVAAKRGMDGLLRVLAKEVGRYNITVNQVAPGWTLSEKYKDNPPQGADDYVANVPLKRMGTDRDVANAVAFLASDLASFVTGAYIPVCGGNVMPCI